MNKQYEPQLVQIVSWQFTLDKHLAFPKILTYYDFSSNCKSKATCLAISLLLKTPDKKNGTRKNALPYCSPPHPACSIKPFVGYKWFQLTLLVEMIPRRRAQVKIRAWYIREAQSASFSCESIPFPLRYPCVPYSLYCLFLK